jgi:hypothetical protein
MPVVTKEASPVKLSLIHETCNAEYERKLKFINLLLYSGHFILIKDLSALVRFTLNMSRQVFVCDYCGTCYFTTLKAYDNHLSVCMCYNEDFEYKLSEVSKVNFRNFKNRFKAPISIYADTESILEPVNTSFGKSSMYLNSHRAVALGYAIKGVSDDIREGTFYGWGCIDEFIAFLTGNVKHKAITLYNQMLQSGSLSHIKGSCDLCKFPLKKRSIISSHACFNGETIKCHASKYLKL